MNPTIRALVIIGLSVMFTGSPQAQPAGTFSVTVDPVVNGRLQITPAIPEDRAVPAGTVITMTATPNSGYVLDSLYCSLPGRFPTYREEMGRELQVTVDRDMRIGVSFIEESAVSHLNVTHNVVYARPGVKPLKYDVFSPEGARNLPIIIIIHGGGWNANSEDIMRGLARELTKGGKFVAVSVDYRWSA